MLDRNLMDSQVVEQLARDTSIERLPFMMQVFVNEIKRRNLSLQAALEQSNSSQLAKEVHALKSCAATFGAFTVSALAQQIDAQCKGADFANAFAKAQTLVEEITLVSGYLQSYYQLE